MKLVRFLMKLNNETVTMELKNGTITGKPLGRGRGRGRAARGHGRGRGR